MRILLLIVLLACMGCGGTSHTGVPAPNIAPPCNNPHWLPLGSGLDGDPLVESLIEYKGELYAIGRFKHSGKIPMHDIARWNGVQWDSVGSGLSEYSITMCVYHDELYVTGTFTHAGGIQAEGIARWNGSNWDSVSGSITDGYGHTMAVYNDRLYVGGSIRTINNMSANGLAIWNGRNWTFMKEPLVGPLDYPPYGGKEKLHFAPKVSAMAVYNGSLYIAGYITGGGAVAANELIRWNDTCWSAPGTGLGNTEMKTGIHAMTVYNGNLYIGGNFDTVDGVQVNNIAMYDGKNWHPVGEGITDGTVNAMVVNDGKLYVAGQFSIAGKEHINGNMAAWDGKTWTTASDSTYLIWDGHGHITTLAVYHHAVYAGGLFERAGGQTVNNVARWGCMDSDTVLKSKAAIHD